MLSSFCIIDNLALASTFNDETNIFHYSLETSVTNSKVKDEENDPENYRLQKQ